MPTNRRLTKKALVDTVLTGGISQASHILRAKNLPEKVSKQLADFIQRAKYELRCLKNNPKICDVPLGKVFRHQEFLHDLDEVSYVHSVFTLSICDIRILNLGLKRHPSLPEEIMRVLHTMHLGSVKKTERAKRDRLRKEETRKRQEAYEAMAA